MRKVVSVSLGPRSRDFEFRARLWDEDFHIRRVGTDGDAAQARRLVAEHDGQVDCIALAGMAVEFQVGDRIWRHQETLRIAQAARSTPVVSGRRLKRIVDRWAIRELAAREGDIFADANVLFLSGIANYDAVSVVGEFTENLSFADPILHFGTPKVLHDVRTLHRYARMAMPLLTRRPYVSFFPRGRTGEGIQQKLLKRFCDQADVVIGDLRLVRHYAPRDLTNKVVVTDDADDEAIEDFRARGVAVLCTTTPKVFAEHPIDLQILHAMAIAHLAKPLQTINDGDYLELLRQMEARPRLIHPQGERRRPRKFAFLYAPPSRRDLFRDPRLRWLRTAPEHVQIKVERAATRLPVMAYSPVRGIRSPTGAEAEGWILYLPATAEQIAARGPAWAERRLVEATRIATRLGAQVLGVGGFARTMTEATQKVAARSEIPITSGAACLVSTDMWAAKQAVLAMGVEQDAVGRVMGTALVVGAGDPEGSVAAELLALVFDRMVIVDREPDRLLELVSRIGRESLHCTVEVATEPGPHLAEALLVVTGLAPGWRGAVPVEALAPGAVVSDCARPSEFGIPAADARPDVLFVLAGELELPGPADLGADLGPPPKVAFAAMAEVVILALEERFECFSLGADVDLARVKEIYKLGVKHGLQLASLRGPRGPLRTTEINLIRERAAAARRAAERPPPQET